MKAGKKWAILFGVATGAAVALMTFGKSTKKNRNVAIKKRTEKNEYSRQDDYDDSDMNYV